MTSITVNISDEVFKRLQKRAKKNLLTPREQIEDIVRRSMLSYSDSASSQSGETDDRLVNIFSRKNGKKGKH